MKTNKFRVHRPLADGIIEILCNTFLGNRQASKSIEFTFRNNKKWGSRDRDFVAKNSYEIVRWWRKLNFINDTDHESPNLQNIWNIFGIWIFMNYDHRLTWSETKYVDFDSINEKIIEADKIRKIVQSIPDWVDDLGLQSLGKEWDQYISKLNEEAKVYLRTNLLKTSSIKLQKILSDEGIDTSVISEESLMVSKRKNLFATKAFTLGLFEVQDLGSQHISRYLDIQNKMRVIDACAGAGGKSLHIGTILQNKGQVISLDIHKWKLDELKKRARRNGIHNIQTRVIENNKSINRLKSSADRLLLDVPCSGLGVLRRNPDSKWKIKPEFVDKLIETQSLILQNYSAMLKPGGKMVYATCSILKSENEDQIKKFLEKNEQFYLIEQKNISPIEMNCDGFYMALLGRN